MHLGNIGDKVKTWVSENYAKETHATQQSLIGFHGHKNLKKWMKAKNNK